MLQVPPQVSFSQLWEGVRLSGSRSMAGSCENRGWERTSELSVHLFLVFAMN